MAQEDVRLSGTFLDSAGNAIADKTVTLFAEGTITPALDTDTTDSSGEWDFTRTTPGRYDVQLVSGTQTYRVLARDKFQVTELTTRNPTTAQPALSAYSTTSEASSLVATFGFRPATESSGVETGDAPSDGDLGYIDFTLSNDHASRQEWIAGRFSWVGLDVSDGSEDGQIKFEAMAAGSLATVLTMDSTGVTGSIIKDEDNMASDSATHLASQQSIKAYVDSQQDTVDTWGEVLALGNASSGTGVVITAGDAFTVNTITETTGGSGVTIDSVLLKDNTVKAGTLTIGAGSITDSSDAIDFGNEALTTTGVITAGGLTVGSAVLIEAELEMLDGITAGTAAASKAVVLDGSKNIATIGTIGSGAITATGTSSFATAIRTPLIEFTDGDDAITIADGGGITLGSTLTATASLQIRTIDYSDGDLAITIADGGGITAAAGITSTAAANTLGVTSFNDASITNVNDIALDSISADGTDINVAVSDNSATALTVKQGSDAYLIIDTANSSESVSIGTGISGTAITLGHGTSEVTVADNLTVTGDLTVSGTTTTVDTTNTVVTDNLLELNSGATSNANDSGIIIERGSTGNNAILMWDESADVFTVGTTTATADSTGNLANFAAAPFVAAAINGTVITASSNFAGALTGEVTGNAATATKLATTRAIAVAGDVTGTANFDGSAAISITTTNADASVDFAHIQNVAANSILGRNANSSGVLSEVALATTQILIGDGTGFTAAALSGDATMTNAGVVTVADDAITLAKMASGTDGNIISFDASGNPVAVATGTDGQVLTSAGAGAPPSFETPTVGDITAVTAGVGLSGGGTAGALSIALDLSELSTVTPADGDFFSTLDSDGANEQKTSTTALATLFAGTSLTASSSVISVDAATTSAAGAVEIATTAEINTSTDAARVMTPDLYAASNYGIRYVQIMAVAAATNLTVADGLAYFHVPAGLDGMDLVEVHAEVFTAPVGSTATFEISLNGASTQMLSTNITIDASETGSDTAATAAVINTSTDDVDTNDLIQINCTQIGSGTAGAGLLVTMGFRIP